MPASWSSGVGVAGASEPKQTAIQHAITIFNAIVRTFPSAILRYWFMPTREAQGSSRDFRRGRRASTNARPVWPANSLA